jgi:hypothetical protein
MKRYSIRRTSGPTLDWSHAALLTDFTLPWNADVTPAATEFRALWDDESLHFRFDCIDHDLVLDDSDTMKERVLDSDRVEIFFTADLALAIYYGFEMSPRAEALIYKARHYREIDFDWSCPTLKLAAEVQGEHYTVSGSLPLSTLRDMGVMAKDARQLFAGVYRADFSREADGSLRRRWMPWVDPRTERPDFHVPGSFGIFQLVD